VPIGIGCAIFGLGVWALVVAHVSQALVKSIVLLAAQRHEWALLPDFAACRPLLHFSGGFVAAALGNYAASEGDKFVVGRWLSLKQLGNYSRAYELMAMPAMFLGEVVDRIVFPLMSRFQGDKERLCVAYGRGVSLVSIIMTPASFVCVVLAPEIVRVVLGPGWEEVVLPFQILVTGLVFRTGYKISDMLARATGTVYARAWRQAIFAVLIFVGALLGMAWGINGVAVGIVLALAINYVLMAWLSIVTTGLGWFRFAALHVRGLVFGMALGSIVLVVSESLRHLGASPPLILATALVAAFGVLAAALRVAPQAILGGDGMWLVATLTGRAGA
jgi:PST family polysaccharide transporter